MVQAVVDDRVDAPVHVDGRTGHFMPSSLLRSQFDTLEPLQPDEPGATVDVDRSGDAIVDDCLDHVRSRRP